MQLYIGGRHQGKTDYVTTHVGLRPVCCMPLEALSAPAINCFHLLVRNILETGGDLYAYLDDLMLQNPGAIILSDEIGLGVVPRDLFERRWREETGRVLCILAARADSVVRISCGLALKLK